MRHVAWPFEGFDDSTTMANLDVATGWDHQRRLPIRYLRYWFCRRLLADLHARLGRPLRVLEVGIGSGELLCFMGGCALGEDRFALPDHVAQWDGLDVKADPAVLQRLSYSNFFNADADKPFDLGAHRYDAIVLLHVLEHLADPDAAMERLLPHLEDGSLMLGGSPAMPATLGYVYKKWLAHRYADRMHDVTLHKHLSVISPTFIRRFARDHGLHIELLTGTFMVRASGNVLEDYAWWVRVNLLWGALFPSLGGEVYFSLRKPRRA